MDATNSSKAAETRKCDTCDNDIWLTRWDHHKTWCNEKNVELANRRRVKRAAAKQRSSPKTQSSKAELRRLKHEARAEFEDKHIRAFEKFDKGQHCQELEPVAAQPQPDYRSDKIGALYPQPDAPPRDSFSDYDDLAAELERSRKGWERADKALTILHAQNKKKQSELERVKEHAEVLKGILDAAFKQRDKALAHAEALAAALRQALPILQREGLKEARKPEVTGDRAHTAYETARAALAAYEKLIEQSEDHKQ